MILAFDNFELDTAKMELRRDGKPERTNRQTFDLLLFMARNPQRIITRDELIDAIWGGRIVSEAALSTLIKAARQALGDNGRAQRFIRTAHGRGFEFAADVSQTDHNVPVSVSSLPSLKGKPSIVVLPFRHLGPDANDGYLSAGLTEDVTANLARFRGLHVLSRATATAFSDSETRVADPRQRLGIDLVLQGSVQRTDQCLRVHVQMIDAQSQVTLLSEKFDRPYSPESQLDIQDEIAALVAARVGDLYGPTGQIVKRLERGGRPKSWNTMVWLARFHDYYTLRDPQLHAEVMKGLEDAVVADPEASDGWAALSRMKIEEYRLPFHYPPRYELRDEALEMARKAVQLDGSNDLALVSLALAHFLKYETEPFEAAAERALDVNPNNAISLAEIAMCYCLRSDFDRAIPLARRAIELSPVHPGWFRMPIACGLFMKGFARAALLEQLKTPVPGYFWYHAHLAAYYAELGDAKKARDEVDTVLQIYPDFEGRLHTEGYVLCVGEAFFNRMATAWRIAGFDLPPTEYQSGYNQK